MNTYGFRDGSGGRRSASVRGSAQIVFGRSQQWGNVAMLHVCDLAMFNCGNRRGHVRVGPGGGVNVRHAPSGSCSRTAPLRPGVSRARPRWPRAGRSTAVKNRRRVPLIHSKAAAFGGGCVDELNEAARVGRRCRRTRTGAGDLLQHRRDRGGSARRPHRWPGRHGIRFSIRRSRSLHESDGDREQRQDPLGTVIRCRRVRGSSVIA